MVIHGLAAKLTAADLLHLTSLGRLFSCKKIISSLSARSFCNNVILTLFDGNPTYARFLTDIMHVQLDNTKHNLYLSLSTRNDQL